jgi:hypothetical protein
MARSGRRCVIFPRSSILIRRLSGAAIVGLFGRLFEAVVSGPISNGC